MVIKIRYALWALIAVLGLAPQPAWSQSKNLIDAAKKEGGKAIVYGSLESSPVEKIIKVFRSKTGLDAEYWRASSTKVMDRALGEYRAGRPLFDLILTNADPMIIMAKEGIFAKYNSPSARNYAPESIHPDLGPRYRNVVVGIIYNTRMIKPADAPKSLEDLLKPQYRGKLVMPDPTQHTTTTQWVTNLWKVLGKEKADRFIRDLAATKPVLVESLLPAAKRVTTGETPIAITYVKYAYIFGKEGAPLDYVRLGKMMGDGHYVNLNNKASHPSAGKAFIDFFLDSESVKIMADMGEFVNLKGVYPPLPDADKIQFVQMDGLSKKEYAAKKKEYQKIFLK